MAINHPLRSDPFHLVTHRVQAAPGVLCDTLRQRCSHRPATPLLALLQQCNQTIEALYTEQITEEHGPAEPFVARRISAMIDKEEALFVSNSLPLRLFDMFGAFDGQPPAIGANRGASGIDGIFASAAGFALGADAPTTLVIGDVAALHDLNSLALLSQTTKPFVAVILNNGGGGIFSLLPIAKSTEHFDRFFATGHSLRFEKACEMFEIDYHCATDLASFTRYYERARCASKATVIEVVTDRKVTAQQIEALNEKARERLMTLMNTSKER